MAGFSTLIFELKEVFEEIDQGKFERTIISMETNVENEKHLTANLKNLEKGVIEYDDYIKFENVPITTPNGDNLISSLNLEVKIKSHFNENLNHFLDQTRNALHHHWSQWLWEKFFVQNFRSFLAFIRRIAHQTAY